MNPVEEFSFVRVAGFILVGVVLFVWLAQIVLGGMDWYRTGNPHRFVDAVGGKLLSIDLRLQEDVHTLRNPEPVSGMFASRINYFVMFDIVWNLAVLVIAGLLVIKFILWCSGQWQWSPVVQVLAFFAAVLLFCLIEVGYTYFTAGKIVIPAQGLLFGQDSLFSYLVEVARNPALLDSLAENTVSNLNVTGVLA